MRQTVRWLTVIVVLAGLVAVLSRPPDPLSGDLASAAQAPVRAVAHVVDHGCSHRTLKGPFGFSFSGTAVAGGFEGKPGAVVGLMTFDGQGNSTGVVTANAHGTVLRWQYTGVYAVNADCTGSIATAAHPLTGLAFQADIVIVNDGATVLFIGTMPELVFRGIAKRLFDLLR